MVSEVVLPPPVQPGDRIAVVSPSWCAPQHFPALHEQALARLRGFGLETVEMPFTRVQGTPAERAEDLMQAFEDDSIGAVMASVGGDDQITVLPHLDVDRMLAHPKRFLGYSDNTNLSNWLWFHGVGSIYGGSTSVHLGPGPQVDVEHATSLRAALFGGDLELVAPARTRDFGPDWDSPDALVDVAPDLPATPWQWSGPERSVTGTTWGGCLEIVEWTLAVGRWVRPVPVYEGSVLILEASEDVPPAEECFRMLRNLGERGILGAAAALLWGRPPVSSRQDPKSETESADLRSERRAAVLRAVGDYNPELVVALDVDFGHTSPQLLVPYGGRLTVDGGRRVITAHFGERSGGVADRTSTPRGREWSSAPRLRGMRPQHNVVLRGGVADGQTLHWSDVGTSIEWEDTGGGAVTYVGTTETEDVDGSDLVVYRVAH